MHIHRIRIRIQRARKFICISLRTLSISDAGKNSPEINEYRFTYPRLFCEFSVNARNNDCESVDLLIPLNH